MPARGNDANEARARLRGNRGLIVERSLAAGLVGLVPLPAVDDYLADAVRRTLLVRIAAVRNVGLDDDAADALAQPVRGEAAAAVSYATSALALLRRRLRRVAAVLRVAERADEVTGTFALATLFDHYCAAHHVGPGVDRRLAVRLRAAIEGAITDARRGIARRGVRGATSTIRRALAGAPRALLVPSREGAADPTPAEPDPVDPAVALAPRAPRSGNALARGATAVADAASALGATWLDELIAAFDARWTAAAGDPA